MELLWTVVQHSGYGYADKPGFEFGLETRTVSTAAEKRLVAKAGGLLFKSGLDAENFAEGEMYPEGHGDDAGAKWAEITRSNPKGLTMLGGLYPHALGTFSVTKIDGLAVYVPAPDTAAIRDLLAMRDELAGDPA